MAEYYSDSNAQEQETRKSKYNSAISQLFRLDDLWKDCHRHSRNRQYIEWNLDLDCVWRELSEDVDEADYNKFKQIEEEINNSGLYTIKFNSGFDETPKFMSLIIRKIYKALNNKEEFLRKLQNKQGKSVAYEDSIDEYMD